jgi:hypothetical protein
MKNGVEELKTIFADRPDLLFRHFENCNVATMRWQRGRNVTEIVNLLGGKGVIVERFELLAWAGTSEDLIEQLDEGCLGGRSRQNAVRIAARAPPLS